MTEEVIPLVKFERLVDWPAPDKRFLSAELPAPPDLPLHDVFGRVWAKWISGAADSKAAPPDYVVAGVLSVLSIVVGNNRWVTPWDGWTEPPIIWSMVIGAPSSSKSPALDAVLGPLKQVERTLRQDIESVLLQWREQAEVAKLAEAAWKDAVKSALKSKKEPPAKPETANPGQEPVMPCLCVSDATVERLAVIVSQQPRGTLLARDELAGWLQGMTRYSGGGSDRPFWLEAYGGRGYSVQRIGREPIYIDRLSIGVVGSIQPDRLKSLLFNTDDDGLLARFLPIWPNPVPIRRPNTLADSRFFESVLERMLSLKMVSTEDGQSRPWLIPFNDPAKSLLDDFRLTARNWETEAEGLLLSFIGKLPGLAVRLSLILAYMDWVITDDNEPQEITANHFGRAAHLVESYILPMAKRSYADASLPKSERAALRLVGIIRENNWGQFTTREVQRLGRTGLNTAADLKPALEVLEEADIIRGIDQPANPQGGRPSRVFAVNPAVVGPS